MARVRGISLWCYAGLMAAGADYKSCSWYLVGLVKESEDKWTLLTDIIGDEDHLVIWTLDRRVTKRYYRIQLDLKINGISTAIIKATLEQSREAARNSPFDALSSAQTSEEISGWAPRLCGLILTQKNWPAYRSRRENNSLYSGNDGANVEVEDDGTVTVASHDAESATRL